MQPSKAAASVVVPYRKRGERYIAAGRLLLFSAIAAWLLLELHGGGASRATAVLVGLGLAYSVAVMLWVWRPLGMPERAGLLVHSVDLLLLSAIGASLGTSTRFYVFYLFLLVSGKTRWQARGVMWTAAAAAAALFAIGATYIVLFGPLTFDREKFTAATVYLATAALLLAFLATHQRRLSADLSNLAAWPETAGVGEPVAIAAMLRHVAQVFDAGRVMLVRDELEEPWLLFDEWREGVHRSERQPTTSSDPLVAPALTDAAFFCTDPCSDATHVVFRSPVGLQRWTGAPVGPLLRARLEGARVMSWPLAAQSVRGRLFVVGGGRADSDDLLLGEVASRMLSARLDQLNTTRQLRDSAVTEERSRIFRDLHDGLLQSLTAWGLQLGDIARSVQSTNPQLSARLHDLRRHVAADQRELRGVIGRLKPDAPEPVDFSLIGRLNDMKERFAAEWGLSVHLDVSGVHALVAANLRAETCRIIYEALVNVARHARTSLVHVGVVATDGRVGLVVQDAGCGFSFRGRYDLAMLREARLGPTSLIERVTALGGELTIESAPSGARLEISLPVLNVSDRDEAQDAS